MSDDTSLAIAIFREFENYAFVKHQCDKEAMSHMNSTGDESACTDELKVYKDEGEEEEQKKSSENLTEDKVGLVIEGEGHFTLTAQENFDNSYKCNKYQRFLLGSQAVPLVTSKGIEEYESDNRFITGLQNRYGQTPFDFNFIEHGASRKFAYELSLKGTRTHTAYMMSALRLAFSGWWIWCSVVISRRFKQHRENISRVAMILFMVYIDPGGERMGPSTGILGQERHHKVSSSLEDGIFGSFNVRVEALEAEFNHLEQAVI
ncbi:Protein pangolin isoform A/H/I/S [Taenia solium]|eukprot:TsM_001150500 transcript=TsM_001150500 gene=TsM_001150500